VAERQRHALVVGHLRFGGFGARARIVLRRRTEAATPARSPPAAPRTRAGRSPFPSPVISPRHRPLAFCGETQTTLSQLCCEGRCLSNDGW
jgi:hypothetical protein